MFALPLWLAEHALAIGGGVLVVALLGLAAAWWRGFVAIGQIIGAVLAFFAAVAKFFTQPADQIAAKILYGLVCAAFALSLGHALGVHEERVTWKAREIAAAAELERAQKERDERITVDVHNEVISALQSRSNELQKQVDQYETERRKALPDAVCSLSDDERTRMRLAPFGAAPSVNEPRVNPRKRFPGMPKARAASPAPRN
jgi:hypothetical protein